MNALHRLKAQLAAAQAKVTELDRRKRFLKVAAAALSTTATDAATLMSRGTPHAGDEAAWTQSQSDIADRADRLGKLQ